MTNDKDQIPNQAQNPNEKKVVLGFNHLDFVCHLDFEIWNLANGIAMRFPPVIASPDKSGRNNLSGTGVLP